MLQELAQWVVAAGSAVTLHPATARALNDIGRNVHDAIDHEGRDHAHASGQPPATRRLAVLTAAQARTVAAAAERVIPRTDTPGASDANVTAFIDHMLAHWYSDAERTAFVAGLPELDARAQAAGGASFVALSRGQQTAMLEALDEEVTRLRKTNADAANNHWFGMLKYLTVFGYCTSKVGMTQHLATWPLPGRYDGDAPYRVASRRAK
jgi:hypothetical protein